MGFFFYKKKQTKSRGKTKNQAYNATYSEILEPPLSANFHRVDKF